MATNEAALIEILGTADAPAATPDAALTSATQPRQKQAARHTLPTCSLHTQCTPARQGVPSPEGVAEVGPLPSPSCPS
jgi:hypothetical protein